MWIDHLVLNQCHLPVACEIWQPEQTVVVLGRSNDEKLECHLENCQQDNVEVLRRKGGGGAVVLHSGCIIVGIGLWVFDYFNNPFYFEKLNEAIIESLQNLMFTQVALNQQGISDICIGDRKLAGTSLFRSRNYLLYQASLLYDAKPVLLERYLAHPSKEPDYRKKRTHGNFVCSLQDFTQNSLDHIKQNLKTNIPSFIHKSLNEKLTKPFSEQVSYLKNSLDSRELL